MTENKNNRTGRPFIIVAVALALLFALSLVPWSRLTNGFMKDFNLLSDILPADSTAVATAAEPIDPDLAAALTELDGADTLAGAQTIVASGPAYASSDAQSLENPLDAVNPRVGDKVVIEDYTPGQTGAARLRAALLSGMRGARIAVIGDSYIEGDIFTMNLRESLQNIYGGNGVGYVPLQSALTGFRVSVRESCKGWETVDIRKKASDSFKWLSGEYFIAKESPKTTFNGSKKLAHLDKWNRTSLLYVSPADGNITITTDAGTHTFPVKASENVACASVDNLTGKAEITTDVPGLVALGAFLDGNKGISVDNMSMRGNSGVSHRKLNVELARQMRQYVDYDMIIVEYGINALSSQQNNYTSYGNLLEKIINRIKACYPNADILVMGIGDRGQKIDGNVASLPTSAAMVKAQRDAARRTGSLFWDTREAMGGQDAVVDWRERGLINADYIHLNAKGGKELSRLFVVSLSDLLR